MSHEHSATTLVGVKVSEKKLWKTVTEKIGEHDFPEDVLFHPKTGKELWLEYKVNVINNGEEFDGVFDRATRTTSYHLDENYKKETQWIDPYPWWKEKFQSDILVGQILGSCDQYDPFESRDLPDQEALKEILKVTLEKHGLWEDQEVKIWTLLR